MAALCTSRVIRMAASSAFLSLLFATCRGWMSMGFTGAAMLTSRLHLKTSSQSFISTLHLKASFHDKDVQTMRAVYTADERTHVGSGAGSGDEDKTASQAFAAENVFTKQVARLGHDGFRCDDGDVQRREQARHSGSLIADVDTD